MMNLEGKLSRREAIAESAKTIAAAFVLPKLKPLEIFVPQKDKAVEVYKAAELSASKRTEWVNLRFPKSELPPYILSIDYATPELLRQPIFRNGPIPYPGAYTKTVFYSLCEISIFFFLKYSLSQYPLGFVAIPNSLALLITVCTLTFNF